MANRELLSRIHEEIASKRRMEKDFEKLKNIKKGAMTLEECLDYHGEYFPGIVKEKYGPTTENERGQLERRSRMCRLKFEDLFTPFSSSGP